MQFSSLDGRDDGEFNGTDFVEIFQILVMQVAIIFLTLLLDKVFQLKISRSDQTQSLGFSVLFPHFATLTCRNMRKQLGKVQALQTTNFGRAFIVCSLNGERGFLGVNRL